MERSKETLWPEGWEAMSEEEKAELAGTLSQRSHQDGSTDGGGSSGNASRLPSYSGTEFSSRVGTRPGSAESSQTKNSGGDTKGTQASWAREESLNPTDWLASQLNALGSPTIEKALPVGELSSVEKHFAAAQVMDDGEIALRNRRAKAVKNAKFTDDAMAGWAVVDEAESDDEGEGRMAFAEREAQEREIERKRHTQSIRK